MSKYLAIIEPVLCRNNILHIYSIAEAKTFVKSFFVNPEKGSPYASQYRELNGKDAKDKYDEVRDCPEELEIFIKDCLEIYYGQKCEFINRVSLSY